MYNGSKGKGSRNGLAALIVGATLAMAQADAVIEVRQNNVVLANNSELTFEGTRVGESTPMIVVVRNVGSDDLVFTGDPFVSAGGGFAEQFSIIQPPTESGDKLSPNGSTAFRVDFNPTIPKAIISATISIPTNDPDTPIFNLQVRGVVPVPAMVVTQNGQLIAPVSQVNLPTTAIGDSSELAIVIENEGQETLELLGLVDVAGGFGRDSYSVVQPPSDTVEPGDSVEFRIEFAPTRTGALSASIGIRSNDIGNYPNGRMVFQVRGVGRRLAEEQPPEDQSAEDEVDANTGAEPGEQAGNENADSAANEEQYEDQPSDEYDNGAPEKDHSEQDSAEELAGQGAMCGFGGPLGVAGAMLTLAGSRGGRRRRSHR